MEHKHPVVLLQSLPIPEWKWEPIIINFVVGLLRTQQANDVVWVIVDYLTKSVHFLPVKVSYNLNKLAKLYVKEIIRLHGAPVLILSDRDPRFTS